MFRCQVMSDVLRSHGLQHVSLPCSSLSPGVFSNSCPLNQRCHPTISSSITPFSSCLQSFLALKSFPMSWLFTTGVQIIGASASASVLLVNIQVSFPLGLTGLSSLLSKGFSIGKYQFFGAPSFVWFNSYIHTWLLEKPPVQFSSVQSISRVWLSVTPWIAAYQASLPITNSWSLLRFLSIESVMPSICLILCRLLLLLTPIPPSIGVFSNESTLCMRWPKYWSFSFSISPSNEHPGLISFRMDWLDLLAVEGTLKSLLQHHSSKESIL